MIEELDSQRALATTIFQDRLPPGHIVRARIDPAGERDHSAPFSSLATLQKAEEVRSAILSYVATSTVAQSQLDTHWLTGGIFERIKIQRYTSPEVCH